MWSESECGWGWFGVGLGRETPGGLVGVSECLMSWRV